MKTEDINVKLVSDAKGNPTAIIMRHPKERRTTTYSIKEMNADSLAKLIEEAAGTNGLKVKVDIKKIDVGEIDDENPEN